MLKNNGKLQGDDGRDEIAGRGGTLLSVCEGFCTAIGERDDIPAVRSPTNREIWTMATKQGKKDNRLSDKEAMHIAETTDVSPGQAKELAEKHGKDNAEKEAKNFKAEG
ncbi:hypothetical protein EN935_34505 [Mesorhizobium sp. M7D.F.Ca.US.004.03.1.1]|nr:hypothetical protein EN935_34505 [Mesorhizobium sp. M7D.F.Ca.US.004.03.1.1]